MADVLYEALKPSLAAGGISRELQQTLGLNDFGMRNWAAIAGSQGSPIAFNAVSALGLMDAYNTSYNLGLTHDEIAEGIKRFRSWHANRFGSDQLDATSSIVAVAAQSLAEAITAKGGNGFGSEFWQDIAKPGGELQKSNDIALTSGLAKYNAVTSAFDDQAKVHGAGFVDGQYHSYGESSFADFVLDIAPLVVAGIATAGALGIGGLAAGAGADAAALAAGDAMAGIGATEATAAATAAAETAATSAWAGLPADTGGWLVGSDGLIGSTGNAIGDSVLNNAGQSVLKSAVTGEDPLKAAVTGAAGGFISSSGVLKDVSAAITPDDAGQVATNAISKGVNAAGTNLITTGDVGTAAEAGLISGVGNYAGGTAAENGANNVVAGAVGGGAAGATNAVLQDGNIATGLITGAAGGGAAGAATELGANSTVANTIGSVVGGVVGSELADDQTVTGGAAAGTGAAVVPAPFEGLTFADMLPPEFVDVKSTRVTDWGSRLANAGRI